MKAGWFLERAGVDAALTGDLMEERTRGRSWWWYWRQVAVAVWSATRTTVFEHKLLALRAIATGSAVNALWLFLWQNFLPLGIPARPDISLEAAATVSVIFLLQAATGWVVARTHRAHAMAMVFVFGIWLVLLYPSRIDFGELRRLLVDSMDQPRFRAYLARQVAWILIPIATEMAGLFAGGLAGARPK